MLIPCFSVEPSGGFLCSFLLITYGVVSFSVVAAPKKSACGWALGAIRSDALKNDSEGAR